MSVVQDEAYDGPEDTDSGEDETEEKLNQETEAQAEEEAALEDEAEEPNLGQDSETREERAAFKRNPKRPYLIPADGAGSLSDSWNGQDRPSSADGSSSIPDDGPSLQGSQVSTPGRGVRAASFSRSPAPSLRPFDRRFHARLGSTSTLGSPRPSSPAFLSAHSRNPSAAFSTGREKDTEVETPWEVVRWTKLRKMTGQAFSEVGKRNYGRPTCISVSASIVLGTSKGIILVFDYNQNLKSTIGLGTKAVESGAVTSVSISADHSTIAGGHASGAIFTWELARPAKPFLYIAPANRERLPNVDGHVVDAAVLHVGFLGIRHTALSSADDKGMAFSHLATRGMGMVARSVKTTRILGRYSETAATASPSRKPSSVLAFSPLPLGNAEHASDTMGLVAMLTPYLLVIVSTMPIAQTQFKAPRPKEVASHSAMTGALAWFPSVKLKGSSSDTSEHSSKTKLVYCWSNVLTVLDVVEAEQSDASSKNEPPSLTFKPRSRWKSEEAIVGVQWLSRSVLAILTITQQLIILEDKSMTVTDASDLIQKHIYHTDLFSQQLNQLVDQLEDEEVAGMHGVVADAFYMSFRAYKGRLFLLGFNEVSFGTLSNWADRLTALVEEGQDVRALELATGYYTGEADKVTVGLPEDDESRHGLVRQKLTEMMLASLQYAFANAAKSENMSYGLKQHLDELAKACIKACISIQDMDFLFDEVYPRYQETEAQAIFLLALETPIDNGEINLLPPEIIKDLVNYYISQGLNARLEEILCMLDPRTMDIDQVTSLCKKSGLYDALLYVWNQALGDYTTILTDLLNVGQPQQNGVTASQSQENVQVVDKGSKVFPYLSYILTGRIYPTGQEMPLDQADLAKADLYNYFFSSRGSDGDRRVERSPQFARSGSRTNFANLRKILDYDAPSFLSMLNEAFEDSFLDGPQERLGSETSDNLTDAQKFGLSVDRPRIVKLLLEVMTSPAYDAEDTVYLDMFVARNLPKFSQFILLPGHELQKVLTGLCRYPSDDIAEDCQLSVEYLLSMYQPPDMQTLVPMLHEAHFYRVLKSVYKADSQYAKLLEVCFQDHENPEDVFDVIADCLKPSAHLSQQQIEDFRAVLSQHAEDLVATDVTRSALTVDKFAPDMHGTMLMTISDDESRQYHYLQMVLEPPTSQEDTIQPSLPSRAFVEQYVRLMCEYNPTYVSKYIEKLKADDLRLDEVLPALEMSGVIDAAVVLMAREGKVAEGIDRLTRHLHTLESALLGMLEALGEDQDTDDSAESVRDLIASIQQYARVGVWMCQGQSRAAAQSRPSMSRSKSMNAGQESLSADEQLWLDLIDAVVAVVKNATEPLERLERTSNLDTLHQSEAMDLSKLIVDIRTIVQETFTALLNATTAPLENESRRSDLSFLRILRAFLSRASLSSPSISNLRGVLSAIFSAYSYEEELLALSNKLLDKDLFVHVNEADSLRRRGWRPLGQVCEGCGRRVWGPGAGAHVWDAFQRSNALRNALQNEGKSGHRGSAASGWSTASENSSSSRTGKGKAVTSNVYEGGSNDRLISDTGASNEASIEDGKDDAGTVVIFACRHMFHRTCLEKMQQGNEGADLGQVGRDMSCPLEI